MKTIIKLSFLALLIIFSLSAISYSQEEKSRRFDDPQKRYTIDLPSDWEDYKEDNETIFFASREDKYFATCYVFGFPVEEGMTLEDMADWMIEGFQDRGEEYSFKITGKKNVNIAGVPALLISQVEEYNEDDFKETIIIDEYFLIFEGQGITIHFDTTKEAYSNFKGDFSLMAKSFYIGERPFDDVIKDEVPPEASGEKENKEENKE